VAEHYHVPGRTAEGVAAQGLEVAGGERRER